MMIREGRRPSPTKGRPNKLQFAEQERHNVKPTYDRNHRSVCLFWNPPVMLQGSQPQGQPKCSFASLYQR